LEDIMHRLVGLVAVGLFAVACGGGGVVATATPGSQVTTPPGATATPGATAAITSQPNTGDNKAKAQSLIPPGSSAPINEVTVGSNYTVQVTSPMTLDQLKAFWATAIPQAGLTEIGRYEAEGTLVISVTNPDGGITASGTAQGILITISLGTSG
jgi:hypothetical protein